jgi:hypothetical protein
MEEKMLEALRQLAFSQNDCARFCSLLARKKYEEMKAAINERGEVVGKIE